MCLLFWIGLSVAPAGLAPQLATADPSAVQVTVLQEVQLPLQQAEVIVQALVPLRELHAQVRCGGLSPMTERRDALAQGKGFSLLFEAPAGSHTCEVSVRALREDGAPVELLENAQLKVLPALELELDPREVDLDARRLRLSLDRPGVLVELTLYDLDGRVLRRASYDLSSVRDAERPELRWEPTARPVARIELRAFAGDDSWADLSWSPIQIELPHEPIYFDARGHALAVAEREKLAPVLDGLKRHTKAQGSAKGLSLYVLGLHESTDDKALFEQRAASVARYLRQKGVRLPVYVGTTVEPGEPDGELLPILASHPPPEVRWQRVR